MKVSKHVSAVNVLNPRTTPEIDHKDSKRQRLTQEKENRNKGKEMPLKRNCL